MISSNSLSFYFFFCLEIRNVQVNDFESCYASVEGNEHVIHGNEALSSVPLIILGCSVHEKLTMHIYI
jgi:hypothetical protein